MTRWALLSALDIGADGDPFLDRLRLVQTPWFGIYLHHIHRPDADPYPHDHPWWFASLVLTGGYLEEVWPAARRRQVHGPRQRGRWSLRSLDRAAAHMICHIDGPLWTLVVTGPKRGDWGFWTPHGFTSWQDYCTRTTSAR